MIPLRLTRYSLKIFLDSSTSPAWGYGVHTSRTQTISTVRGKIGICPHRLWFPVVCQPQAEVAVDVKLVFRFRAQGGDERFAIVLISVFSRSEEHRPSVSSNRVGG